LITCYTSIAIISSDTLRDCGRRISHGDCGLRIIETSFIDLFI